MASREEQETTITYNRFEDVARIWTAYPPHIRKFRKDDRVTEVAGEGEEWAEFTVPTEHYDPVRGLRKRVQPLSDEERARRAEAFRRNVLKN